MERNEISMFIEVKIDISDKKKESRKLKNWSKCSVKIEAIKSLPCFLRITVVHNIDNDWQHLCLPIHLPGVQIRLTNSRSKRFSYGLTWKHNRKRSYVFFAFESDISFERHMRWLKESLKNLELHRQEILETTRKSRYSFAFVNSKTKLSIKDEKTLQDILGPLPKIPDKRDRRVSAISEIYEEITDSEKIRRISQASGIYEEMQSPIQTRMLPLQNNSPPGLPVRTRINTFETDFQFIPRCNTNPDLIMSSKKSRYVSFRNRLKRSESVSGYKVCSAEDLLDKSKSIGCLCAHKNKAEINIYQNVNSDIKVLNDSLWFRDPKLLRVSISNPDFSEVNPVPILPGQILKLKTSVPNVNNMTKISENINTNKNKFKFESVGKIIPNFTDKDFVNKLNRTVSFSKNPSRANLISSKINIENVKIANSFGNVSVLAIDDVSGYCTMVPIKEKYKFSEIKLNKQVPDEVKNINPRRKLIDSNKENYAYFLKTEENNGTRLRLCQNKDYRCNDIKNQRNESNDSNLNLSNTGIQNYFIAKNSLNNDEKIPSYHNYCTNTNESEKNKDLNKQFLNKKSPISLRSRPYNSSKTGNSESLYISSHKKRIKQNIEHTFTYNEEINNICKKIPIQACEISENFSVFNSSIENKPKDYQTIFSSKLIGEVVKSTVNFESLLQSIAFKFDDSKNNVSTQKNYLKLSISKPNHLIQYNINKSSKHNMDNEKNSIENKINSETSTLKKITLLPIFKKLNFSPLKAKINNVLQRNFLD